MTGSESVAYTLSMLLGMVALAALSLLAWVVLWLTPDRRWPASRRLPASGDSSQGAVVGAVVPARNEASSLPHTLPLLLRQGPPLVQVILVDDRSSDGTATVATRLPEEGSGTRLQVLRLDACPAGWAGKVHAMARGVQALEEVPTERPRWVLFTDADIEHPPDGVRRFVAKAEEGPFDLVSVMARLRAEAFWEKVLVPTFVWFFHAMYPFRRASDPTSWVAAAAGGAMLVRLETLKRAGGPAAWKGAVIDDLALARGLKRAGGRLWLGLADDVVSTRAYPTLGSIVDMVARSAFLELRQRYILVPGVWLVLLVVFVVPPVAAIWGGLQGHVSLLAAGVTAWVLETLHVLPAFRHHRVPGTYALLLPLAAILYAWMTTVSAWRHLRRRGTPWRNAG